MSDNKVDLFDNIKDLGFDNLAGVSIYVNNEVNKQSNIKVVKEFNPAEMLYDKKIECPVCNKEITVRTVKSRGVHLLSQDTDFMPIYSEPNPLLYDIWMCTCCGYTALPSRFNTIGYRNIALVKEKITARWKFNKTYPTVYTPEIAIEMYQMALLNALIIQAKDSEKAIICLKLSWLYRLINDKENEKKFQLQVQQGFIKALENEYFPVFGMDETCIEYLIGEIYRRLGDNTNALLWYGRVISSRQAKPKIKDLARDQKDVISRLQR